MNNLSTEQPPAPSGDLALVTLGNLVLRTSHESRAVEDVLAPYSDYLQSSAGAVCMPWPNTPQAPKSHTLAGLNMPFRLVRLTPEEERFLQSRADNAPDIWRRPSSLFKRLEVSTLGGAIAKSILLGEDLYRVGRGWLKPRLQQVGVGVALELSSEEIASRLGVSVYTVKKCYRELGSPARLACSMFRYGYLVPMISRPPLDLSTPIVTPDWEVLDSLMGPLESFQERAPDPNWKLKLVPMDHPAIRSTDLRVPGVSAEKLTGLLKPFAAECVSSDARTGVYPSGTLLAPAPHTVAGFALPLRQVKLDDDVRQFIIEQSNGLTNDRPAPKEVYSRVYNNLFAAGMKDAITKAIVSGADIGQTLTRPPGVIESPRELQIAMGLALGLTYDETAAKLLLSRATLRKHLGQLFRRWRVDKAEQLVKYMFDMRYFVPMILPPDYGSNPKG